MRIVPARSFLGGDLAARRAAILLLAQSGPMAIGESLVSPW